jgi:E3 ubiquitin-protein ligase HUWE1
LQVADDQPFGRTRSGQLPPPEATTHPLLLDNSAPTNRSTSSQLRGNRRASRTVITGNDGLLQTIEELVGGGAVQLFHHFLARERSGGGAEFHLDMGTGTLNLERGYIQRRPPGVVSTSTRVERPRPFMAGQSEGRDLDPLPTLQRWTEEIKVLHGEFVNERVSKLSNHVALALLPAAAEELKAAKLREEQERLEAQKAEEAAAAKAKEEAEKIAQQEAEDKAKREAARMESDVAAPESSNTRDDEVADPDTEMADASSRPPSPREEAVPVPMAEAETVVADQVESTEAESNQAEPAQAESSNAAASVTERITVTIHGSSVDITDTGIDPTFLEALPDDMREEVLNQHVRDQRASRVERPPDSQISSEFLDALPPEIRAEIIQQERLEQVRQQAGDGSGDQPGAGVPTDMDPASIIASLDPQLRQVVLLDQDDGFIQTLPSHILAEVGAFHDGAYLPRRQLAGRDAVPRPVIPRKVPPPHDAIQLLDKAGITVLVRLLFFPQVLKKNLLFKVLVNLCENAKTRTELFNLLLSILQDGTGDLTAVDKSFAQMSFRNSKPLSQQSAKAAGKQKAGSEYINALALPSQNEAVPDLIAQRCLECLTFIVSSNELSSLFFLTEHELPAGLRRAVSKKGKGKEKQAPQTHYPIILLLGLLDRQSLLKTPSIMESVVSLLATVTRPLSSIKDGSKKEVEAPAASTTSTAPQEPQTPPAPVSGEPAQPAAEAIPAPLQVEPPGTITFLILTIYTE